MYRSHVDGTRTKYGCICIKETLLYENVTKREKRYVYIYILLYIIVLYVCLPVCGRLRPCVCEYQCRFLESLPKPACESTSNLGQWLLISTRSSIAFRRKPTPQTQCIYASGSDWKAKHVWLDKCDWCMKVPFASCFAGLPQLCLSSGYSSSFFHIFHFMNCKFVPCSQRNVFKCHQGCARDAWPLSNLFCASWSSPFPWPRCPWISKIVECLPTQDDWDILGLVTTCNQGQVKRTWIILSYTGWVEACRGWRHLRAWLSNWAPSAAYADAIARSSWHR